MPIDDLIERYRSLRARTMALAAPLSEEDCCVQSMPDASPVKWHLAHTTWFFETFILEPYAPDFHPYHPAYRVLFNSYYNGIGEKHPRPERGMITRPGLSDVFAYRRDVDERIGMLLNAAPDNARLAELIEMGIQHEQQHQELIMTDLKHLLSKNPLHPAYSSSNIPGLASTATATPTNWQTFDAGIVQIGHSGETFCFDNEMPCHRQFLEAFSLASQLVTNEEYLEFVRDGGYANASLWLSEGWEWVQSNRIAHPFYWEQHDGQWHEFTLYGQHELDPHRPAVHLSFFEADAYARWTGARLPTEFEWERAAAIATASAANFESMALHPPDARDAKPGAGLAQLFGSAWQWTLSSYAPYPGYSTQEGAIGEYNGKFMSNQYVLRGSSCVTPEGHTRISYRNFFPATARWQFSGIRLAKSC